jgi:Family of unknown function (DUF6527)
MRTFIAKALRRLGFLRFDLIGSVVPTMPEKGSLLDGDLALVVDGDIEKWACMRCPGGCGETISLSLNPNRRPRWKVGFDRWQRPTVEPSVWQKNECGCHFVIRDGIVNWCADGRPRR